MKNRDSRIELLRIVCMVMILFIHANYKTFGAPQGLSLLAFCRSSFESLTLNAVLVFILITGYFSATFTFKRLFSLLFQCAFAITLSVVIVAIFRPNQPFKYQHYCYWFIASYIGLLLLTPILNTAINSWNKKTYLTFISTSFILFPFLDLFLPSLGLRHGYSTLWFAILYLIGRYLHNYPLTLPTRSIIAIIIVSTLLSGLICCIVPQLNTYTNPLITISSIGIFVLFTRLPIFVNKHINSISRSTLMVYLTNDSVMGYIFYIGTIRAFYKTTPSIFIFLLKVLGLAIIWFLGSIIIGHICSFCWKHIYHLIEKPLTWLDNRIDLRVPTTPTPPSA